MKRKRRVRVPRPTLRSRISQREGLRDNSLWGNEVDDRLMVRLGTLGNLLFKPMYEHFFLKSVAATLVVILLGVASLLNLPVADSFLKTVHGLTLKDANPAEILEQIQPVMKSVRDFNWRQNNLLPDSPGQNGEEEVMAAPVNGVLVSPYGNRMNASGAGTEMHYGIDVQAEPGSPVFAALSGSVMLIQEHPLYGTTVYLSHANDLVSIYGRVDSVTVEEGDPVRQGQQLGVVSDSGKLHSHLHFEVWKDSRPVDPQLLLEETHRE